MKDYSKDPRFWSRKTCWKELQERDETISALTDENNVDLYLAMQLDKLHDTAERKYNWLIVGTFTLFAIFSAILFIRWTT